MPTPLVSVVIVSYNTREFLHLCLLSVLSSTGNIRLDVIVVDNGSTDGTPDHLKEFFPDVQLIRNTDNTGFSKACNAGARIARDGYLLFLNPDTVIPPDAIDTCLQEYLDTDNPGGLGANLVDGSGRHLRESARMEPTPLNTLAKLLGVSKGAGRFLKTFAYYDWSGSDSTDILPGAFFFIKASTFRGVGGFDEAFFMYGEDIDLSVRLLRSGKVNRWLRDLHVVHFKGESTQKGSDLYVSHFYGAMDIYARIHGLVRTSSSRFFLKSLLSTVRFTQRLRHLVLPWLRACGHFILIAGVFMGAHYMWALLYHGHLEYFPLPGVLMTSMLYSVIFLGAFYWHGIYLTGRQSAYRWAVAVLFGGFLTLALYALLPETMRFSRMSLLIGCLVLFLIIQLITKHTRETIDHGRRSILLISGRKDLVKEIADLQQLGLETDAVMTPAELIESSVSARGKTLVYNAEEGHFDQFIEIIRAKGEMTAVSVYIGALNTVLSSIEPQRQGQVLDRVSAFGIDHPLNQHQKQCFDVFMAIFLLVWSPVITLVSTSFSYTRNVWSVFRGHRTFVSYMEAYDPALPTMKSGFIMPLPGKQVVSDPVDMKEALSEYAVRYNVYKDIILCLVKFPELLKALVLHGRTIKKD